MMLKKKKVNIYLYTQIYISQNKIKIIEGKKLLIEKFIYEIYLNQNKSIYITKNMKFI